MRSLILVTILCLISTPAFACVFHTDCNPGAQCIDGVCSDQRALQMTRLPVRPRTIPPPRGRAATTIVIAGKAAASRAQA